MSFAAFGMGALSKLVGNLSDTYGTGNTLRDKQREEVQDDFLERERLGIQARVEGFKAAGLHPLLATGYQGGNSPASVVGGSSPVQYSPGGGDSAGPSDPNLDRINAANARRAEAEADMAELSAHNAYRALANQPGQVSPSVPQGNGPTDFRNLNIRGLRPGVSLKPDEVTMGAGGLTAGTHPGMTDFAMPSGHTWRLPSDKLSQALEDLELAKYIAIIQANARPFANWVAESVDSLGYNRPSLEMAREISRYGRRYPPKGTPSKWPPRMHGGRVR